jgi:dolichyl-phosphate beta-glucosyltransferase
MTAISVIIPAYNEECRLPAYLRTILDYLGQQPSSFEVIVVDDGSSDGTAAVVERFRAENGGVRLIALPSNMGKGYAVKTGMLNASGELRLFTDADGATPITELERLKKELAEGADVAVASRAFQNGSTTVQSRLHRKLIGNMFNFIVRVCAVGGIRDTQCGFKLFTADSANTVFSLQTIKGFGFDVEVLYLSRKKGYRIVEVPVNWTDVTGSKVRLFRDSCRMFRDVLQIRINDLTGAYRG